MPILIRVCLDCALLVSHAGPLTRLCCLKADEISHVISELEKSISCYKEEYAGLISQAQAIKADLATVESKVSQVSCNF